MRRWLLRASGWMAGLAIAIVWLISLWRPAVVRYSFGENGPGPVLATAGGCALMGIGEADGMEGHGLAAATYSGEDAAGGVGAFEWLCIHGDEPRIEWRFAGFHFVTGPDGWRSWGVALPYWFLLLIWARLYGARLLRARRSRRRLVAGSCPRCGYDMRFSGPRCPECGEVVAAGGDSLDVRSSSAT